MIGVVSIKLGARPMSEVPAEVRGLLQDAVDDLVPRDVQRIWDRMILVNDHDWDEISEILDALIAQTSIGGNPAGQVLQASAPGSPSREWSSWVKTTHLGTGSLEIKDGPPLTVTVTVVSHEDEERTVTYMATVDTLYSWQPAIIVD